MANKIGRIGVGSIVQMKQNDKWIGYVLEVKAGKALTEFTSLALAGRREGSREIVPAVNPAHWVSLKKLRKLKPNRGFGPRVEFTQNEIGGCADTHWS